MEALPKALDPLFDSNTIPDFVRFLWLCGPKNDGQLKIMVFAEEGGKSRVWGNHGFVIQENMCTDLLGPFLRPQEAPGGPK